MTKKLISLFFIFALAALFFSCDPENKALNIFSVQDDMQFGKEFDTQILTLGEFSILNESQYPEAYSTIRGYLNTLLATGKVAYANQFNWTVRIIEDDATVNAFAVPGGYLYFYTGLIKTLENEAEFTGVMAHEMAHVARRHSTRQLTKAYGIEMISAMLLGESSNQWVKIASEMASGLIALQFSRNDEYDADKHAVIYNYQTEWDARGVADFFERMDAKSPTPVFLSTHPSDEKRVKKVNDEWAKLGGEKGKYFTEQYNEFKKMLP